MSINNLTGGGLLLRRREIMQSKTILVPPDNEIWYRSTDGTQLSLYSETGVIAHTYVGGLGKVTFDSDVVNIGSTFSRHARLDTIYLPQTARTQSRSAFSNCKNLRLVYGVENFTSIGRQAFDTCSNLEGDWYLPNVTSFGDYALNACGKGLRLIIPRTTPPACLNSSLASSFFKIYVPASAIDTYKAATGWSSFASRIYPITE